MAVLLSAQDGHLSAAKQWLVNKGSMGQTSSILGRCKMLLLRICGNTQKDVKLYIQYNLSTKEKGVRLRNRQNTFNSELKIVASKAGKGQRAELITDDPLQLAAPLL